MNVVALTKPPKSRLVTISLGQLLDHEFPPREDLIFPWLRTGESAMLWAQSGTGKTLLALTLAVMVAGGGSVLGWQSPRPHKVLLADGEMNAEDLKERAGWLIETVEGIDREAARQNLMILSRNWQEADVAFPDLAKRDGRDGKPSDQDAYLAIARHYGAELFIADNFSTLAEVTDENEAAAMTPVLAFLLRLKQARIACLLVHHSGKTGDTYRGSSKLATTFEVVLGLKPLEDRPAAGSGAAFKLEWTKYRRQPCDAVRSREVRLVADGDGRSKWEATATEDDDIRRMLDKLMTGMFTTQRELAKGLDWEPMRVTRMKRKAIREDRTTEADWREYLKGEGLPANQDF